MLGTAVVLSVAWWWPFACHTAYCQAVDDSRKGEQTAITIVANVPEVGAYKRARAGEPWNIVGSIELASRGIPVYCPHEYLVTVGQDRTATRWRVDIATRSVGQLYSGAELLAYVKSMHRLTRAEAAAMDRERLDLCMDGRPPVLLNPEELPVNVDGDGHDVPAPR